MDCSPPGSSVHGIFQARLLEWVAIFFSGGTFLTQGSNSGCPHCKQIPHCQSHQRPWGKWAMKWGLAPPPNAEDSGKLTWTTQASPSAQTPWKWSGVWVLLFSVVPQCKHWRLSSFFLFLFLAALGLHWFVQVFSSCGKQGLLSSCDAWATHCGGFSCCGAWTLVGGLQ